MDAVFERWSHGLVWLPEYGMGHYPVTASPYDAAYFAKYRDYADTGMGVALTDARVAFVRNRCRPGPVVDIGIGAGQFLDAMKPMPCLGFDVNPEAMKWLRDRGAWCDPRGQAGLTLTFWDSLEHIAEPAPLLAAADLVFASLPIFHDGEHVIRSRHFRKDEHCWYFTRRGLERWMAAYGFVLVEHDDFETRLGREDIQSFAFERLS